MKNKKVEIFLSTAVAAVGGALLYYKKKKQKEDKKEKTCTERKITFYEAHVKRTFDVRTFEKENRRSCYDRRKRISYIRDNACGWLLN